MTSITATLLPNGKQQFLSATGAPLAGGTVGMYIPSTLTPKTTWQDPFQSVANSNPITLDAAGEALIYGSGQYRQIVKDSLGNTIWDQLTQDFLGLVQGSYIYWGATSGGSTNAQTVTTTPTFPAYTTPLFVSFIAGFTNTGATTFNANALGVKNVYKQTPSGPAALTGGEIVAGNIYNLSYDGTEWQLQGGNAASAASYPGAQVTIASASNTSLAGAGSNNIAISGTTNITSFGTSGSSSSPFYFVRFTGASPALSVIYNATTLQTPSQSNLIVNSGDTMIVQDLGSNNWKIVDYTKNSGQPVSAFGPEVSVASAGTVDLGLLTSNSALITGTTTITSFGTSATTGNQFFMLRFNGSLQITYNATSMITPNGVNLNTNAGDQALVQALGSGNWKFVFYQPANTSGGSLLKVDTYATPGTFTWTMPTGTTRIEVECVGGGAGGTGASAAAPGGAAGGYAFGFFTTGFAPSQTVTVGSGGAGAGFAGGTASSFGGLIGAQGASGGGTPFGTFQIGINGQNALGTTNSQGGSIPPWGIGGRGGGFDPGIGFGGGGGGNGPGQNGGAGAGGLVIVRSFL